MKTESVEIEGQKVRISESLVNQCRELAKREGRTLSGLLRLLLERGLESWKRKGTT